MSTVFCQSIESCSKTQLVEPISLTLKLYSSNLQFPHLSPKSPVSESNKNGWDCIQALSNASDLLTETTVKAQVYVHPLVKRSASMLSVKSLEMCTENLGSETGTDIAEDDIFSIPIPIPNPSLELEGEADSTVARERRKSRHKMGARKAGYENLPPPLTTICGANSIRVQSHRESGRLVMTAVSTSPRRPIIHAERSNGRLTMSLLEDFTQDIYGPEETVSVCGEDLDNDETECGGCEEDGERIGAEEEEENDCNGVLLEEDKDGRNMVIKGQFGIGEFQRPSRCKEGGAGTRRLISWERGTSWVAT